MSVAGLLADAVLLAHLGFILFVALGALLLFRWPRVAWVHVPAFAWGALIEFAGWVCPLTPLEQHLRETAGRRGYEGSFVEHYLWPLVYPEGLTRDHQFLLGFAVLAVNAVIYTVWLRNRRR